MQDPSFVDRKLIEGLNRALRLLNREAVIHTKGYSAKIRSGEEKIGLNFVDAKQKHDPNGSFLVVDETAQLIISAFRYGEASAEFVGLPDRKISAGRRYLLYPMSRA